MKPTIAKLRRFVLSTEPRQLKAFDLALSRALEVVVIGSAANATLGPASDLDVLFVGNGKRTKTRHLDLIWISEKEVRSESWLGSELAIHAAAFGVWLKGRGTWRKKVFFSDFAVAQKCERILIRLSRVYLKRRILSPESRIELLSRCVLDMQRAVLLARSTPVPPTMELIELFLRSPEGTYSSACQAELLGDLGRYFVESFIPKTEIVGYLEQKSESPVTGRIFI